MQGAADFSAAGAAAGGARRDPAADAPVEGHGPARRPGRPVRLPVDDGAGRDGGQPSIRLAWLLLVCRLMHPDPAVVSRARFVDLVRASGQAADASRVSRWESGQQPVPPRLLESYEQLLGMAPSTLLGVWRLMVRRAGDLPSRAVVAPVADPVSELDTLLTAALSTDAGDRPVLSGVEWIRLADLITDFDLVFLDRSSWSRLCTRLLTELHRCTGQSEMTRWEAAATLGTHPVAAPHLITAMVAWVDTPFVQRVAPTMTLLGHTLPAAGDELLCRLLGADNGRVLVGATLRDLAATTAAVKISRHTVADSVLERLERYVTTRLTGAQVRPSAATLALAVQLPRPQLERVRAAITDPGMRRRLLEIDEHRLVVPQQAAQRIARSATHDVRTAVPNPIDLVPDPLLERMVTEALFHVSFSQRWMSGLILSTSPYSDALIEVFLDLTRGSDLTLAGSAWRAVLISCDQTSSPRLARAALAEPRRGMQGVALNALSRSWVQLDDDQVDHVVQMVRYAETDSTRLAAVAVLARHAPHRLVETLGVSETIDGAVGWWQALGPRI